VPTGFANAAKIEVTFNMASAEKVMRAAAEQRIESILEQAADLAVQETEAIIRKEFVNDRPASRRKSGSQHLAGSIRARVVSEGRRMKLVVYSTANARKVGMLEFGKDEPYAIQPRGTDVKDYLFFPSNKAARPLGKRQGPTLGVKIPRRQAAYGGLRGKSVLLTKTDAAIHPPYVGKHFMQRGGERAIRKVLGR
jgi:hypothetical protein